MSGFGRDRRRKSGTSREASVISYIGGKYALIHNIVPIIEWCAVAHNLKGYLEMCGGGGRMLLNVSVSLFEYRLYNELDLGLCKLFACLGDRDLLYELIDLLETLGCSEEVFELAKSERTREAGMLAAGELDGELDMVTAAAYIFILSGLSRASDLERFDQTRVSNPQQKEAYFRKIQRLEYFYETLQDVHVSQGDCRDMLDLYRKKDDYFAYLDPPYIPHSMVLDQHYSHSWTAGDHNILVDKLLSTSLKVALSGYDNKIYDRLIDSGWRKLYLKNVHVSSSANGRRQEEFLWLNFDIPSSLQDRVCQFNYSGF